QIAANVLEPTIDGLTPIEQLQKIEKMIKPMLETTFNLWHNEIIPALKEYNIEISDYDDLTDDEKEKLSEYFKKEIFPVLTPPAFDPDRPFPNKSKLSLKSYILVREPNGEKYFCRVKVANIFPKIMQVESINKP